MPGSPHRTASYTFPPEPSPGNTAPYPPAVIRRRWFTWLGIAAALLICYSRIYLAKHFPVDLLLGTGVGILTGLFMLWLYKKSGRGFFKPLDPSGKQQAE